MNSRNVRRHAVLALPVAVLLFVMATRPAFAALGVPVYWVSSGTNNTGRLGVVDLDGSSFQVLLNGLANPIAIDLDPTNGHIYWTESSKIRRADLNGTNVVDILTNLSGAYGISLDLVNSKIYWTNVTNAANNPTLQRANLDGTNIQTLFTGPDATGVEVDTIGNKVYWNQGANGPVQTVRRANLDGTSPQTLYTVPLVNNATGALWGLSVGYDSNFYPQGRVYFGQQLAFTSQTLESMDLNGGPTTTVATNPFYDFLGVDFYPGLERVLWSTTFGPNNSGEISWSKPDGSMAQLISTVGLNRKASDIAIWPYPPAPEPAVSLLLATALTNILLFTRARRHGKD